MKKAIIGIFAFLMIMAAGCEKANNSTEPNGPDSVHGEWELVYEAQGDDHYHGLCFSDENNGWVVGDSGIILHTDDGGHSWGLQESGTMSDLRCVYFASDERGWIAGSNNTVGMTIDGGASWVWQQPEGESRRSFTAMSFVNKQTGWLVDNYGGILHTEDGGLTWVSQNSGTHNAFTSVYFLDAKKGWATATNRIVLHTTDGGNSWTASEVDMSLPSGTMFNDVFFIDSRNGWIATATAASSDLRVTSSPLLRTTDGGESWLVQSSLPDKFLRSIRLADEDVGWLLGMESLFYTEDGGDSWSSQLDSGGDPFVDICLVDGLYAWVLSFTGKVYKFVSGAAEEEEEELVVESWQIGENWEYGQQAVWGDIMVGSEIEVRDRRVVKPYISTYNLHSREKERVLELPADRMVYGTPAIHGDRVVWASVDRDVFLLDLKTGEVCQLTNDDNAQVHPRIYGDTVVWLDNRHGTGERYPYPPPFDVYAYDLDTGEEKRLTSATTAEGYDRLAISSNLVVWTDSRHADSEIIRHSSNEPDYNNEIYVYNLTTNQERRVTTYPGNDNHPAIDGGRIVWLRHTDYREADVFVYDVETGKETQVSHSDYATYTPAIYEDRVVWTDARASKGNTTNDVVEVIVDIDAGTKECRVPGADIYLYDLKTQQEVRLTSPQVEGFPLWVHPCIHNDFIVYMLNRQIGPIVYGMKLTYP